MLSRQHKQFYHRAGFGIGVGELTSRTELPIVQIVEEALKDATQPLPSVEGMNGGSPTLESSFLTRSVEPRFQNMESTSSQLDSLRFEWFEIMCHSGLGLREKMALFWHGHFACQCWQESTARQYLEVLRNHALGNFKTLLRAIVKTPAMIIFLNNQQNRKDHPNENFARELMELFTMGHGTYSEFDVKEAARAFTGWSTDEGGDFVFRPESHDPESKVFLGKKGRLDGEDIVEIILKQPATKLHLARSLYRFFVNEQIDPDAIDQIASYIAETDFDMARVM
ncbi:MAG: DUF1800 family protein, partial [Saprospiraceae bacterium]|nr:DUF1800 family protein [Saprospiraceae bacterium]